MYSKRCDFLTKGQVYSTPGVFRSRVSIGKLLPVSHDLLISSSAGHGLFNRITLHRPVSIKGRYGGGRVLHQLMRSKCRRQGRQSKNAVSAYPSKVQQVSSAHLPAPITAAVVGVANRLYFVGKAAFVNVVVNHFAGRDVLQLIPPTLKKRVAVGIAVPLGG